MSEHDVATKKEEALASGGKVEIKKGSDEDYEQHCLLFPTYATRYRLDEESELTNQWNIRIRGWAFSMPKTSKTLALFLGLTSHLAEIQKEEFHTRASFFWASNIDHKQFTVRVVGLTDSNKMAIDGDPNDSSIAHEPSAEEVKGDVIKIIDNAQNKFTAFHSKDETHSVKVMPTEGNCSEILSIPQLTVEKWMNANNTTIPFFTEIFNSFPWGRKNPNKSRLLKIEAFQDVPTSPTYGVVDLVEPEGFSVISDIDDTIKDTEILSSARTIISNTFLQPAREVKGMAQIYYEWYNKDVTFHYVSNSPWQLYPMLRHFFKEHNFPSGSAHLKFYDGIIKSVRDQKEHPMASKLKYIGELLKDFPKRKFILIGDTGELDPEIYTKIAREHEGQILKIFVRDVSTVHLKGLPAQPAHRSYLQTFTSTYKRFHSYYAASDKEEKSMETFNKEEDGKKSTEFVTEEESKKESMETFNKEEDGKKFTETVIEGENWKKTTEATTIEITETNQMLETGSPVEEQRDHRNHTSRLMNHLHSEISHIRTSLGLHSEDSRVIDDKTNQEELKTPLEQFHHRLELLKEGLPEGLFCIFTDPDELRNDPVIRKALNY